MNREYPFNNIPGSHTILMVEQEIVDDDDPPLICVLKADKEREWLLETEKRLLNNENDELLIILGIFMNL